MKGKRKVQRSLLTTNSLVSKQMKNPQITLLHLIIFSLGIYSYFFSFGFFIAKFLIGKIIIDIFLSDSLLLIAKELSGVSFGATNTEEKSTSSDLKIQLWTF